MMQGKIMKGIAGFYYVDTVESGIYECKAKGIFRKQKMKPLVGDDVEIVITHEGDREGNIISILPRTNEMIRPAAANVGQALVLFAMKSPDPNLPLLDRFLVALEKRGIAGVGVVPQRVAHRFVINLGQVDGIEVLEGVGL